MELPEKKCDDGAGPSQSSSNLSGRPPWISTFRAAIVVRRQRWTLTWTGRLLTLTILLAFTVLVGRNLCGFLAVDSPVRGEILVVEGWVPMFAYSQAAALVRNGSYRKVIVATMTDEEADLSGNPRDNFGADDLIKLGIPAEQVTTASADAVHRDRTFHSATAVKRLLLTQGQRNSSVDVLTVGPHARRSRLLYEEALGKEVKVGVICIEDRRFDPDHWWRSSEGFRAVVYELIAYIYTRIYFSPLQ